MTSANRSSVEHVLAEWRAVERELDETPPDAAARPALADRAARLRDEYQQVVLRSRGRIDQLEGAAEDSWERLDRSAGQAERSRDLAAGALSRPDGPLAF